MDPAPSEEPRPSILVTVVIVGLAILFWLVVAVELVFLVPFFEKTFVDFQLRLPVTTSAVITVSRWFVKYFYVLPVPLAIIAVAVAASTWVIRHVARKPKTGIVWSAVMLLLPVLVAVSIVLICYLPYAKQMEGLQK